MPWPRTLVATVELEVPLREIVGKQRPRFDPRSKRTYTPKKTASVEKTIRDAWLKRYGSRFEDFDGIMHVSVTTNRPLAKSNPKYWEGRADTGKPDGDNVLKLVLDALNGVAYADDSHIEHSEVNKLPRAPYGDQAFVRVSIDYYTESRA